MSILCQFTHEYGFNFVTYLICSYFKFLFVKKNINSFILHYFAIFSRRGTHAHYRPIYAVISSMTLVRFIFTVFYSTYIGYN